MDKIGLDKYAALFFKLSLAWILCLCISFGIGVWWSVTDANAICIPVIDFLSVCALLVCGRCNQKYVIHTNTPLKYNVGVMGVVFLAKISLAIWTSVIFEEKSEVIANIVVLWVLATVFLITFLCLVLPIALIFWDLRSEDLVKVQNIGGELERPDPIPISSDNIEIYSTRK